MRQDERDPTNLERALEAVILRCRKRGLRTVGIDGETAIKWLFEALAESKGIEHDPQSERDLADERAGVERLRWIGELWESDWNHSIYAPRRRGGLAP
jgi:hypothetical protein